MNKTKHLVAETLAIWLENELVEHAESEISLREIYELFADHLFREEQSVITFSSFCTFLGEENPAACLPGRRAKNPLPLTQTDDLDQAVGEDLQESPEVAEEVRQFTKLPRKALLKAVR